MGVTIGRPTIDGKCRRESHIPRIFDVTTLFLKYSVTMGRSIVSKGEHFEAARSRVFRFCVGRMRLAAVFEEGGGMKGAKGANASNG